jgi:oligopeptide transport system permease protein
MKKKKSLPGLSPIAPPIDYGALVFAANDFEVVGTDIEKSMAMVRPSISYWKDAWRRLKMNKVAIACLVFLGIMAVGSVLMPVLSPFTFREQHWEEVKLPMFTICTEPGVSGIGKMHIFGTDALGRDMWTRVWSGGQVSLFIGLMAAFTNFVIGMPYGSISGFIGGRVDNIMMRVVEIINGIPYLIVVTLLMVVLPGGVPTIILAMAVVGWTGLARLVRGQVVSIKEQEYVIAAKTMGASRSRLIFRHIMPNTLSVVIVSLTMAIPGAIFTEAFLSFIGIGVQEPAASWGSLCQQAQSSVFMNTYLLLIPAAFICLTMLSLNLFGDALRNVLDPRMRK